MRKIRKSIQKSRPGSEVTQKRQNFRRIFFPKTQEAMGTRLSTLKIKSSLGNKIYAKNAEAEFWNLILLFEIFIQKTNSNIEKYIEHLNVWRSMKKDVSRRILVIILYVIAVVAFIVSFIMVYKEFRHFNSNSWKPHRLLHPRWFQKIFNGTQEKEEEHLKPIENNNNNNNKSCFHEKFQNILLIISFGDVSEYESIPLFELLYKKTFKNRIYCGSSQLNGTNLLQVDTRHGAFLYECLDKAIKTYNNYSGYLFTGEDILLNYWNMRELDLNLIWEDDSIKRGPTLYEQNADLWEWWQSPWGVRAMEKVYEYFVELNYYDNRKAKLTQGDWKPDWDAGQSLNKWLWNGDGEFACYWTNRSVFYIPQSYTQLYLNISKHFRVSGVRHSIAIPTITRLLTLGENNVKLIASDINESNRLDFLQKRELLTNASKRTHIVYIDGSRKERRAVLNHLRIKEYAVGKFLKYRKCEMLKKT